MNNDKEILTKRAEKLRQHINKLYKVLEQHLEDIAVSEEYWTSMDTEYITSVLSNRISIKLNMIATKHNFEELRKRHETEEQNES